MSQQNIREYNYKKWFLRPVGQNLDLNLASDERNYNEEVVFSTNLIAQNDGNRLPIYFDLNNSGSSQLFVLNYGVYNSANTLVSLNYYNPNNENLDMFTASTLCDIGLTGIDNGLVDMMSGETISYTMGLFTGASKFDRYSFDRRFKMFQVTGYTDPPNERFSGNTDRTVYEIVSKTNSQIGTYNQLYGGFYQGFFKLFGYDYEVFPNRTNKGWTVEMALKARQSDEYGPTSGETTLNITYPENENTFFYFGTRGENKFYHHASGSPASDTGYTRVTQSLEGVLKTCACANTGVTNSRCIEVYNPIEYTVEHNIDCNCYCSNNSVLNSDKDPLYDSMSNAFSVRLNGDPSNPGICVKVLKLTGDCVVTGTTPITGITYQTGYTVTEYCSESNIFDYCASENPDFLLEEHWFLVDLVWERNTYFDTCDLYYRGGLGLITDFKYVDSLSNNTVNLIEPPVTHTGSPAPDQVEIVNLNERWLIEKSDRLGALKIYVNGKLFYVINGFEEIIPRGLNVEKEKQLGVPFNISWGGGTQGLRESLTFKQKPACDISYGVELGLNLLAIITPGSIRIDYILTTLYTIDEPIILNFTHILGSTQGNNISINFSVTIPPNETSGTNFIILLDDYGTLDGDSTFSNVTVSPGFISGNIDFSYNSQFIGPTPTPTNTETPTPTPTNTETPTPTPTPSSTPEPEQVIDDAIITNNTEYINVGGNLYLKFIDPINVNDAILTNNDEYIIVGDSLYLKYINPSPVPQPSPTQTPTVTPTPSITPSQTATPTPTNTETPTPTPTPTIPVVCDLFTFNSINANTTINSAIKTTGGGWNASAYSVGTYTNPVYVTFNMSNTNIGAMGGFSVNPTLSESTYENATFGLYSENVNLKIYENGNNVYTVFEGGIITPSDLFKVEYDGTVVNYYYNGSLVYTSLQTITQPLHIFFPLLTENEGVINVCVIESPLPTPTPTMTETPTPTETTTPTPTPTNTETPTPTETETPTPTPSITPSETPAAVTATTYVYNIATECACDSLVLYSNSSSFGGFINVYSDINLTTPYPDGDVWYNGRGYQVSSGVVGASIGDCIDGYCSSLCNSYTNYEISNNSYNSLEITFTFNSCSGFTVTSPPLTLVYVNSNTVPITNCVRQIVVPTLWNGVTSSNSNTLQLTQTSETLQIQVNDIITDNIGATSFVGIVSSDGTYTYVFTGPGGGVAFPCQFPLTFSGAC